MALLLIFTTSLTAINAGLGLFVWHQLHQNQQSIHCLQATVAALRNVMSKQALDMEELKERKAMAEMAVDSGTSSIEIVHRTIANTTFGVLDKLSQNELYKAGTGHLRQIHDGTSQGVYGSIRIANREIHSLADILLKQQSRRNPKKDK
ncbi:MAG: hypothetical protein EA349_12880 [Halomonadaceae bacterium]|nr:MAG: hypothetical protein EA349_12880 [Halomonadaceae bacterium]